jgi:hypothetical protein
MSVLEAWRVPPIPPGWGRKWDPEGDRVLDGLMSGVRGGFPPGETLCSSPGSAGVAVEPREAVGATEEPDGIASQPPPGPDGIFRHWDLDGWLAAAQNRISHTARGRSDASDLPCSGLANVARRACFVAPKRPIAGACLPRHSGRPLAHLARALNLVACRSA